MARSGRNASGQELASSRRMVTASWIAASASSRRPSSPSGVRQGCTTSWPGRAESVRAGRGPAAPGRTPRPPGPGGQRILRRPRVAEPPEQVAQRHGQVGPERVRPGAGQLPADGDGFLDGGHASSRRPRPSASRSARLFSELARSGRKASGRAAATSGRPRRFPRWRPARPPGQVGQPERQVVLQRAGQVGPENVRAGRGELLPGRPRRLPRWRPARSSRPRSAQPVDRSFSDIARSGRKNVARSHQLPADGDGLLDGGQRVLPSAQLGQPGRTGSAQRHGQVGPESARTGRGQLPGRTPRLPRRRRSRILPPPQVAQPERQLFSDSARRGRKASGRAGGKLPVGPGGFLDGGQRILPPPQVAQPDSQVVQRPGQEAGAFQVSVGDADPVLGDLLLMRVAAARRACTVVLGHLAGELGGQLGLEASSLQCEARRGRLARRGRR